jgi:DNA-binding NarL/FixJ family response regulator
VTDVAVVSALPAVRAGLRALLAADSTLRVTGESGRLTSPDLARADVLVLDVEPGTEAPDVIPDTTSIAGGLILLGTLGGDTQLTSLIAGRPFAYLPRDAAPDQLLAAVRAVAAGLVIFDPAFAVRLASPVAALEGTLVSPDAAPLDGADQLTGRETEVLQLVAQGLSNKLIARRLQISEHTVKFHVAAVLGKLGAASRTEAVHLGARRGVVSL